jgi:hypothetical protein
MGRGFVDRLVLPTAAIVIGISLPFALYRVAA